MRSPKHLWPPQCPWLLLSLLLWLLLLLLLGLWLARLWLLPGLCFLQRFARVIAIVTVVVTIVGRLAAELFSFIP